MRLFCEFQIWWKEKFFFRNQSINIVYPNKENAFIVPNHEKEEDYYVNPFLPHLIEEL